MVCVRRLILPLAVLGTFGLGSTLTARADNISFRLGNNPQPGQQNKLLGSGPSGNSIFGTTNSTNILVGFASTTDSLNEPAGRQARIEAADHLVNSISIFEPSRGFTSLIINPFQGNGIGTVTATTPSGQIVNFQYSLDVGNNFIGLLNTYGNFSSVTISATEGIGDIRQTRISAYELIAALPESTTILLFGCGIAGIAAELRRRRRSKAGNHT